ncbi:8-hydroxyquercetin 8-O-methyltransferase-like [Salvia hispanica]|uniref:8-hydroxyquercetin 8-O-methyltransferase-like n=1 Tax=Salvia hispanica TaxID=49212 RepID=UPI0020099053|nr:8-hydroxyquercetin 8-O-methyltransferase-like [Salvia hispanica]
MWVWSETVNRDRKAPKLKHIYRDASNALTMRINNSPRAFSKRRRNMFKRKPRVLCKVVLVADVQLRDPDQSPLGGQLVEGDVSPVVPPYALITCDYCTSTTLTHSKNAVDSRQELLDAQSHVWNLIYNYISSMSLKSAIQLGILADALSINKAKSPALFRLMRILVHSKIFDKVKIEHEEEAYSLTRASRLLLRDEPLSFAPLALVGIDAIIVDPFHHMAEWFKDEFPTPFFTRNGKTMWEFGENDEGWNKVFNEGMSSDSHFVSSILVNECKHVFEGLKSVVDVAGGTRVVAKAVAGAFPGLKCIALDLPQVVDGLEGSENLRFVGGDMFEFIPPADAVILKWILHNWSEEDCVRILKKCKEAIGGNGGKLIIVDMVIDCEKQEHSAFQTQLLFDVLMMTVLAGKERTEKEWAHLFSSAGFQNYKITPILKYFHDYLIILVHVSVFLLVNSSICSSIS